jgi:hypothetical protein
VLSNALIPVVGGAGVGCHAAELRPSSGVRDIVVVKDGQGYQYLRNDGKQDLFMGTCGQPRLLRIEGHTDHGPLQPPREVGHALAAGAGH